MTRELGDRIFENNIYNLASIALSKRKSTQIYPLVNFFKKIAQKERIKKI